MKRNIFSLIGIAVLVAVIGLGLAGCPTDGGGNEPPPPETVTVTFDSKGGGDVAARTVTKGQPVGQPDNPSKAGYLFVGWYGDEEYSAQWNFTSAVNESRTLYAKWLAAGNAYTIRFDSTGGSAVQDTAGETGDVISLNGKIPDKAGFVFGGWYKDQGYTNSVRTAYTVAAADADANKVITLYAKWVANSVFDLYEGVWDGGSYGRFLLLTDGTRWEIDNNGNVRPSTWEVSWYTVSEDGSTLSTIPANEYMEPQRYTRITATAVPDSAPAAAIIGEWIHENGYGYNLLTFAGGTMIISVKTTNGLSGTLTLKYQYAGDKLAVIWGSGNIKVAEWQVTATQISGAFFKKVNLAGHPLVGIWNLSAYTRHTWNSETGQYDEESAADVTGNDVFSYKFDVDSSNVNGTVTFYARGASLSYQYYVTPDYDGSNDFWVRDATGTRVAVGSADITTTLTLSYEQGDTSTFTKGASVASTSGERDAALGGMWLRTDSGSGQQHTLEFNASTGTMTDTNAYTFNPGYPPQISAYDYIWWTSAEGGEKYLYSTSIRFGVINRERYTVSGGVLNVEQDASFYGTYQKQ